MAVRQSFRFRQRLSLWESWTRSGLRGRGRCPCSTKNEDISKWTTLLPRSTPNFFPSAGRTWKPGAGSSWTLWWWAVTPMWTTPALALPSSAACWKPRATRWACWRSPAIPTARTSSGSASPSTAFSSAAAMWTAWSATIPWQKFPAPRTNTPPAVRPVPARTAAPPCTPSLPSRLTPTCR